MAHVTQTRCDDCGKDITKGAGRMWRLVVMSEVIGMLDGPAPQRHDAGAILPQQHFCDEACLAHWATAAAARKAQAEVNFVDAQLKAKAEAAAQVRGDGEETD